MKTFGRDRRERRERRVETVSERQRGIETVGGDSDARGTSKRNGRRGPVTEGHHSHVQDVQSKGHWWAVTWYTDCIVFLAGIHQYVLVSFKVTPVVCLFQYKSLQRTKPRTIVTTTAQSYSHNMYNCTLSLLFV